MKKYVVLRECPMTIVEGLSGYQNYNGSVYWNKPGLIYEDVMVTRAFYFDSLEEATKEVQDKGGVVLKALDIEHIECKEA